MTLDCCRGFVRQKAVMCLFQFQLLAPDLLQHCQSEMEATLMDKDPGVAAAAVHVIHHCIQVDQTPYLCPPSICLPVLCLSTNMNLACKFCSIQGIDTMFGTYSALVKIFQVASVLNTL